jgi:predicted permease
VHLLGRLRPGVTDAKAEADLHGIVMDLQARNPADFPKDWRIKLKTFKETFPSGIIDALWILFGAVGVLLLIACANVSNLLLSRMSFRQREISIRAALGASRTRLISQLLCESLVLGIAGGVLGILAAYGGLRGIIAMVPPDTIPDEAQITLNVPVLLFTLAISVGAAILFGLAPALHSSGKDFASPLKETGRGISGSTRQRVLRSLLVVGEVALSLMLLVGASLMIRTLISVQSGELGIQPDRILTLRIPFARERYREAARRNAFLQDVVQRVATTPGVAAVGVTAGVPPIYSWSLNVEVVGDPEPVGRPTLLEQTNSDFEKAFGLSLTQGRYFTKAEEFAQIHSAAVNETFARRYLGGRDALGRIVKLPGLGSRAELTDRTFQIVGVVKDRINRTSTGETLPQLFIPYTVIGAADRLMVLTHTSPQSIERAVREQVYAVDRIQPVTEVKTFEALIGENVYSRPRFNLLLFTVFAALGLILALFGVYGVISNAVSQRTREIGIRLALGATFPQVIRMVLSLGIKLLGVGIAVGLIGSLASVRLLSSEVRNVSTFDPYSFAAVTVLILATGLFASFWPARRAAKVDPVTALRVE